MNIEFKIRNAENSDVETLSVSNNEKEGIFNLSRYASDIYIIECLKDVGLVNTIIYHPETLYYSWVFNYITGNYICIVDINSQKCHVFPHKFETIKRLKSLFQYKTNDTGIIKPKINLQNIKLISSHDYILYNLYNKMLTK